MSKRRKRQQIPSETAPSDPSSEKPITASPPEANGEAFGAAFCVLGVAMIVIGACLTFKWMAVPSDSRFLGSSDVWQYYGPIASFLDYCLHHGELPIWNPLYFCGQPFAANPQSFLFYPPNLIRSLLTFGPTPLKTHTGIAIMVIFQLLLGGMSAFFLARRHALSYGAALVAAFAFVFSAPLVTRATGHCMFINSVCWAPLTLLLVNHALSQASFRRRLRFAVGAALSWGMTILGGVPVLIMLSSIMAGLYGLLFRALHPLDGMDAGALSLPQSRRRPASPSSSRFQAFGRFCVRAGLRDAAVFGIIVFGGILIASPLLLPGAQFAGHTERANKSDEAHEDFAPVHVGWDFLRILVVYQGHGHYEGIRASGAIVFMLAVAGIVCRPRRETVLFGLLLAVLLDCSLSKSLLFGKILYAVAPYQLSNPGRAMIVACLPLGLLAGLGTDAVIECPASWRTRLWRSSVAVSAGLFVVLVLALAARPQPTLPVGAPVILLPALACVLALAAVWFPQPILWGTMLAMLVLGETLAWNRQLIPSVVPEESRFPKPMEQLSQPPTFWSGNERGVDLVPNVQMYSLEAVMNGYDPMHLREVRDVLCTTKANKAFRRMIYAVEPTGLSHRGNLILKRAFWLTKQYVDGPLPEMGTAFPPTTTVFLQNPGVLPIPRIDATEVPHLGVSSNVRELWLQSRNSPPFVLRSQQISDPTNVFKLKPMKLPPLHSSLSLTLTTTCAMDVLPLFRNMKTGREDFGKQIRLAAAVTTPQSFEIPLPDIRDVQIMINADFKGNTGELAFVEAVVRSDLDDENDRITVVSRSANTVEADLRDLPGHRLLLFVDAFYPGWRAYIDGHNTPILRANDAFKAILVPPGSHRVKFQFRSLPITAGIFISIFTLTAMVAAWLFLLRKPAENAAAVEIADAPQWLAPNR